MSELLIIIGLVYTLPYIKLYQEYLSKSQDQGSDSLHLLLIVPPSLVRAIQSDCRIVMMLSNS